MPSPRPLVEVSPAVAPFFLGVDLGGSSFKIGLVDDRGQTLEYLTAPTHSELGAEDATRRLGEAVRQVIADAGVPLSDVARIGLGVPGVIDQRAGHLIAAVNLPGWINVAIAERLSSHAGLPVSLVNDATAAAFGENWLGRGRRVRSLILLTLGTGIGSGIIIDQQSIDGEHGHGAECGHMIIEPADTARLCNCGHTGHLEAYASATAVIKRTREALAAGRHSSLVDNDQLSPRAIAAAADAGDALALEIVDETARYLGIGIVTLLHVFDPDVVLLGGAMTFGGADRPLGSRFLCRIRAEVEHRALQAPAAKTLIDFASLGGDAGYLGAAGLARQEQRRLAAV